MWKTPPRQVCCAYLKSHLVIRTTEKVTGAERSTGRVAAGAVTPWCTVQPAALAIQRLQHASAMRIQIWQLIWLSTVSDRSPWPVTLQPGNANGHPQHACSLNKCWTPCLLGSFTLSYRPSSADVPWHEPLCFPNSTMTSLVTWLWCQYAILINGVNGNLGCGRPHTSGCSAVPTSNNNRPGSIAVSQQHTAEAGLVKRWAVPGVISRVKLPIYML